MMRGVIRGRELELLRLAADAVVGEGVARRGSGHLYYRYADGREVYRRSEQMWSRDPIFQAVTVNPELLENIGQCVAQTFYPWNDSLVVKLPHEGAPVAWHQDPPYGTVMTGMQPIPSPISPPTSTSITPARTMAVSTRFPGYTFRGTST
jgi:hypothetical protein